MTELRKYQEKTVNMVRDEIKKGNKVNQVMKRKEMVGKRFGRLTGLCANGRDKRGNKLLKCECDCGNIKSYVIYKLLNGTSKSCGCLKMDIHASRVREKHPNWRGGKHINGAGYVMIYSPEYHRMHHNYAKEHIVMAEKVLGKHLPVGAEIHHYQEKIDNNKLVICQDHAYHMFLHVRTRAFIASGDVNYRKCKYCKEYDDPKNLFISDIYSGVIYHRKCNNEYQKNRNSYAIKRIPNKHN